MNAFKPFPELFVLKAEGGDRIVNAKGEDVMQQPGGADRLVECWNALRKIAFPLAHIPASEEREARLEQLRKDAWAKAESLQAQLDNVSRETGALK